MELATNVHNLLSIPLNKYLFSADIKHKYWVINIYPDDCYYLTFYVPGIGQVQSKRMPQRAKTSSLTFNKLINIVLRPVFVP